MIEYGKGSSGNITVYVYKAQPQLDERYIKGNIRPEDFSNVNKCELFLVDSDGLEYCMEETTIIKGSNKISGKFEALTKSSVYSIKGVFFRKGEGKQYTFYIYNAFKIIDNDLNIRDINLQFETTCATYGLDGLSSYESYILKVNSYGGDLASKSNEDAWINKIRNTQVNGDIVEAIYGNKDGILKKLDETIKTLDRENIISTVKDYIDEKLPTTSEDGSVTVNNYTTNNNITISTNSDGEALYKISDAITKDDADNLIYSSKVIKEIKSDLDNYKAINDAIKNVDVDGTITKLDESVTELDIKQKDIDAKLTNFKSEYYGDLKSDGITNDHWCKLEVLLDNMKESIIDDNSADYLGRYYITLNNKATSVDVYNYAFPTPNNQQKFLVQMVAGSISRGYRTEVNKVLFNLNYTNPNLYIWYRIVRKDSGTEWSLFNSNSSSTDTNRQLQGVKVGILGGSQCYGAFNKSSDTDKLPIKTKLESAGATLSVTAVNGAGVGTPNDNRNICYQAKNIEACDIYVIWLQTNDYTGIQQDQQWLRYPTKLGNVSDVITDNDIANDNYTFQGALYYIVNTLLSKNSKAKILFITPTKCIIGNGGYKPTNTGCIKSLDNNTYSCNVLGYNIGTLYNYVKALQDWCEYYDYPCLDLFNGGLGITPQVIWNETHKDGTHLNDKGYELLSNKIVNFIING